MVHSASPVSGLRRLLKSGKQPSPLSPRPPACSTPLERLPVVVLCDIGNRVDTRDVLHLSLCSRRLRTALLPLLYATVELTTNKHCKSSLLALSKNPDATQHIRRLVVRPNSLQWTEPGDELDEDAIASLLAAMAGAGHMRALEAFEWDGIEMPHDPMWLALRKSCRALRRIGTTIGEAPLSASSPLWDFSDLRQVALNVKCHSLDWLAEGLPKTEKLPRKFWAMLLERCPRLEDLTIGGTAPAPRVFDVRHVAAGRFPRLRRISLGGMVLVAGDSQQKDDAAFQAFIAAHTGLREVRLHYAEGSPHVPSVFAFPHPRPHSSLQLRPPLPHLESFAGPLRLARSLPVHTRMHTLKSLTLTTLLHSASAVPPTCAVLQAEFGALRELSVWIDLSFGQPVGSGQRTRSLRRSLRRRSRSSSREGGESDDRGGRGTGVVDDMLVLRALLAACPRLTGLELACFTRPTFSFRDLSKTLQSSAPNLESFTLVKMHKSSEDSAEFIGSSSSSSAPSTSGPTNSSSHTPRAALRLAMENPRLRSFRLCTTLDAWLSPREGRVKVVGVYEVVRSATAAGAGASMLYAHEYRQRNITGRMYARHVVVPLPTAAAATTTTKERPLSLSSGSGFREGVQGALAALLPTTQTTSTSAPHPPSAFPHHMTTNIYASLSRVGSVTSTVNSHQSYQSYVSYQSQSGSGSGHHHEQHYEHHANYNGNQNRNHSQQRDFNSRPQSYYATSESSHDHHQHGRLHRQSLQFQIPQVQPRQEPNPQYAQSSPSHSTATATATVTSRWALRGHRHEAAAANSTSPSAWGSGSGLRKRRSSLSSVVGSIASVLVGRGVHKRESGVGSCHGSTSTTSGSGFGSGSGTSGSASSVSRSASGSSSSASPGGSPVVPAPPQVYALRKSASVLAAEMEDEGFVLV